MEVEKSDDKLVVPPTATFATPSHLPPASNLSPSPVSTGKVEVSAESQVERAARVCDIIHEQREK